MKPKILLIDDDIAILQHMQAALTSDYNVLTASIESSAIETYERERPPVVTLDLSLDPLDLADLGGIRLLQRILALDGSARVIVITGNSSGNAAAQTVQLGAFDYLAKPVRLDELKVIIGRAFRLHTLLQRTPHTDCTCGNEFHDIVGVSKVVRKILRALNRIAVSNTPVLICGEPGTEKQTVAQAIHFESSRRKNPFVVVDCGAIPENVLEAEIFGQAVGTRGQVHRVNGGKLALADTGTLFLDRVDALAPQLQVRLLKYLQNRTNLDNGNEVDTTVIAATRGDLKSVLATHSFCEGLYDHLKSATLLELPPLRHRKEEVVPLAEHFLKKACTAHNRPPMVLSSEAQGALLMHTWPGNVRELETLMCRSVVHCSLPILKPSDLGFALDHIPIDVNLKLAKTAIETGFVKKALFRNHGIIARAARELGISRVNLYELIDKYSIRLQEFKIPAAKSQIKTPEVS